MKKINYKQALSEYNRLAALAQKASLASLRVKTFNAGIEYNNRVGYFSMHISVSIANGSYDDVACWECVSGNASESIYTAGNGLEDKLKVILKEEGYEA